MIPSASALYEIRARAISNVATRALVLGNPENDLPSAHAELMEVAEQLNTKAITGKYALSSLVAKATDLQILHIATHSGVSHLGAWVRFADGDVPAMKIAKSNAVAKLAVLASCSSAANQGENLWGSLGGLFLSSGTPSVFVTQWSVNDEVTRQIVSEFYQYYTTGETAAESLAMAQRSAISNQGKPSDWAAYAMLGK